MEEKTGIIYVLINKAMPNLVKIGITKRKEIGSRLNELYKTGVPLPFECLWAGEVEDCLKTEQVIHNAFRDNRINLKREFFKIEPDQVIPILQLLCTNEVTNQVETELNKDVSEEEKNAEKEFHRPMLNLEEMGIPIGSILTYIKDSEIQVEVTAPKKVKFNNKEYSLTALTKELLALEYRVAPCPYWTFNGKNLKTIYDETYSP